MACCWPHARRDWGKVFCCLPLALVALIVSLLFGAWSGWEIYTATQASNFPQWEAIIPFIVGCLKALIAVMGLFAVLFRVATFANLAAMGYKICIAAIAAQFVVQWVWWILNMFGIETHDGKEWRPTDTEIVQMVLFTIFNVLFFILAFWILSTFRSLHMVLKSGGHGWERRNYKDVKIDKALVDDDMA